MPSAKPDGYSHAVAPLSPMGAILTVYMGDVKFDEQASYQSPAPTQSELIGFVIKTGLAKDAASARVILLIAAVCCIVAAIFIFSSAQKANEIIPTPPPAGVLE